MRSIVRACTMTLFALMLSMAFAAAHSISAQSLIISEYRLRGPGLPVQTGSASDEFIEIYNTTGADYTVLAADGSAGFALVASDGAARFVIPNGTVIPARGHYLGVNSVGYSLGGTTGLANGDITYTLDIPDRSGIALFNTANQVNFITANRLDAVGYTVSDPLYREGIGFDSNAINEGTAVLQYSFYRDTRTGTPKDTNDNLSDFLGNETFVFTTSIGKRLGAPGPENLLSPVNRNDTIKSSLIDPLVSSTASPNRTVDGTPFRYIDSTTGVQIIFPNGTLTIRRYWTNRTGQPVTKLRFRLVDVTAGPGQPTGVADLRALSVGATTVTTSGGSTVNVFGTRLEQPPQQLRGGGWNATLAADSITLLTPLAPGDRIPLQFLTAIQQGGSYRFLVTVEASR